MTDVRTLFRWVGGALTAVSALITFAFGLSISSNLYIALVVAIAFACAAAGSAYIWPFVADALNKRRWINASFIVLVAVLFTGTDVVTNFGSISWQRSTNAQRLEVQDICNGDACGTQAENQKKLKLWEDRRARLLTEKPWLATVSTMLAQARARRLASVAKQTCPLAGAKITISLQPLSVVGETGVDITAAVASPAALRASRTRHWAYGFG